MEINEMKTYLVNKEATWIKIFLAEISKKQWSKYIVRERLFQIIPEKKNNKHINLHSERILISQDGKWSKSL
jgi:hypothetical protein